VGGAAESEALDAELARVRESGEGRFVWMRGRRRVGKSRVVQEFCDASGDSYCFYQAPKRPREDALREFCEGVAESSLVSAGTFAEASFGSWPAALRAAVAEASAERPAIVVIDELPYLTERDSGFAADLQKAWDRSLERSAVLRRPAPYFSHGRGASVRRSSTAHVERGAEDKSALRGPRGTP
jgi:AAA+ ATPase superfamily predicted ATPase